MPSTITTVDQQVTAVPAHRVWIREHWGDPWEVEPYLYCDSAATRASPEKSSAVLHYDYGTIIQHDDGTPIYYPPLDIKGWYVKVEIDWYPATNQGQTPTLTPLFWYGYVLDDEKLADGAPPNAANQPQPTGKQKLTCMGLEDLLDRETVRASTVLGGDGVERDVNRPIGFNWSGTRSQDHVTPNRTPSPGNRGAYLFHYTRTSAQPWSSSDAVGYLLSYRTPSNYLGDIVLPFQLDTSANAVPTYDQPRIEIKTDTVKELLDKLISRKRLISYWVTVTESEEEDGDDVVLLKPFTFLTENLEIPTAYPNDTGGFTEGLAVIEANPNQVSLNFDWAFDVEQASLRGTGHERYDEVVVRGARKGSCFTLSTVDGTLVEDWDTGTLQTEYQTAASTQGTSYTDATYAERQWRNANWRAADKYKRVFRWFRVPDNWNQKAGDGEGGDQNPAFPEDDNFDSPAQTFAPGQLFEHHLPLLSDHDYSGSNIGSGAITNSTPAGGVPERLRPMAFLPVLTTIQQGSGSGSGTGSGSGSRYQYVEKLAEVDPYDKVTLGGAAFTCSLRMQDRNLGIELNVHGAPQHAIAAGTFVPADGSDISPKIDYRHNLMCTVFCLADEHVEAWQPQDTGQPQQQNEDDPDSEDVAADPAEEPEVVDLIRTLLIDLSHLEHGNALRLDYVAPGTVVAIKDGLPVRSNGGYVRDDRGRLNGLAIAAWNWYQLERQAFTLRCRQIDGQFAVGDLITTIQGAPFIENVNTPVTSVEWDLLNGTTTITTGFAELDFGNFL